MKIKLPVVVFLTAFLLAVLGCGNALLSKTLHSSFASPSAYAAEEAKNDSRLISLVIETESGERREIPVDESSYDLGVIELDKTENFVRIILHPRSPLAFVKEQHITLTSVETHVAFTSYSSNKYYMSQYRLVLVKK